MNNEPVAWMLLGLEDRKPKLINLQVIEHLEGTWIPLYTHPAKELHLSLQKSKETGELLAVTYTDDEHRIVEVLWKKPPAKTLTIEEILEVAKQKGWRGDLKFLVDFADEILRKAQ